MELTSKHFPKPSGLIFSFPATKLRIYGFTAPPSVWRTHKYFKARNALKSAWRSAVDDVEVYLNETMCVIVISDCADYGMFVRRLFIVR